MNSESGDAVDRILDPEVALRILMGENRAGRLEAIKSSLEAALAVVDELIAEAVEEAPERLPRETKCA